MTGNAPRGDSLAVYGSSNVEGDALVRVTKQATALSHPALPWSTGIRVLHWLTVALLSYAVWVAFFAMGPGLATVVWLPAHASIGAGLLLLVLVRLVWRTLERSPRHRVRGGVWIAARLVQATLYGLLLAIILTGWIAYSPMALMPPVKIAGMIPLLRFPGVHWLPALPYRQLHRILTWVFLCLTGLHIAAAVLHGIRRDGIVSAMTFKRGP